MRRSFNLLSCALILTLLTLLIISACGDDDSDSDSTSTAVSPEATATAALSSVATATVPAESPTTATGGSDEASDDVSPTVDEKPEASPTPEPESSATQTVLATSAIGSPIATEGDDPQPEPTEAPSGVEARIMTVLLGVGDMPDGWEPDGRSGPVDPDSSDGEELCDTDGFPAEDQSLGQVETQFANDDAMIVMLQKVWAFPDELAADAFAFWEDASGCGAWSDDNTTITVDSLDDPGLGDQSFAVHLTFDATEEGLGQGDYIFVRAGSLLMLIAYIGSDDADFSPLADPIETATERLQEVAAELDGE